MKRDEHHLVSAPRASVPGTVLCDESPVPVLFRELPVVGEGKLQGRDMRSQQDVGEDHLFHEIGPRRNTIFRDSITVRVGPTVKPVLPNASEIIGRNLIAKIIPLIYGGPQVSRLRVASKPYRVPQSTRVYVRVATVGVSYKYRGTSTIRFDTDIGLGADGHKHLSPVWTENQ